MSKRLFRSQRSAGASRKLVRSALAIALILIVLSGTGCLGWGAHGGEGIVPSNIRNSSGEHLRITRTDSSRIALRSVAVFQDTLFGTTLGILGRRVAIPLPDITKVERQKFTRRSAALTAGIITAFGVLTYYLVHDLTLDTGFPSTTP